MNHHIESKETALIKTILIITWFHNLLCVLIYAANSLLGAFINSHVHFNIYLSVDLFRTVVIMTQIGFLETDNFFEMDTSYISLA